MQQTNKRNLIKYGTLASFLNVILLTSILVLYDLYFDCPKSGAKKKSVPEVVEQEPPAPTKPAKKELPKKRPITKKAKTKKVVLKDRKRIVVKRICLVDTHKPDCRKPNIVSMPAELKEYYNYDPIKKVWIWMGD